MNKIVKNFKNQFRMEDFLVSSNKKHNIYLLGFESIGYIYCKVEFEDLEDESRKEKSFKVVYKEKNKPKKVLLYYKPKTNVSSNQIHNMYNEIKEIFCETIITKFLNLSIEYTNLESQPEIIDETCLKFANYYEDTKILQIQDYVIIFNFLCDSDYCSKNKYDFGFNRNKYIVAYVKKEDYDSCYIHQLNQSKVTYIYNTSVNCFDYCFENNKASKISQSIMNSLGNLSISICALLYEEGIKFINDIFPILLKKND